MAEETTNFVVANYVGGSFEAHNPFNSLIDPNKYYTVIAVRTVEDMKRRNLDLWLMVYEPSGMGDADYENAVETLKESKGSILVLSGKDGSTIYLPSNYVKSFPRSDGVSYERLCVIADCGACPPDVKPAINLIMTHVASYIEAQLGIKPTVTLGTMPTIGYVSKEQAQVFEQTRLNAITDSTTDVIALNQANQKIETQQAYILWLEARVRELEEAQTP